MKSIVIFFVPVSYNLYVSNSKRLCKQDLMEVTQNFKTLVIFLESKFHTFDMYLDS